MGVGTAAGWSCRAGKGGKADGRREQNIIEGSGSLFTEGGGQASSNQGDPAAIGGGWYCSAGNINISGGSVYAWGGSNNLGIGGGAGGNGGSINISGGTVVATGRR